MKHRLLISLHLPKTAGNSFLKSLDEVFGEELLQDYSDMPKIQQFLSGRIDASDFFKNQDTQADWGHYKCIHGHFLPAKYYAYRDMYDLSFITWLRDPVDRLISHYYFFKRSYDPKTAGPLFSKIIQEEWSLERFCFCEEYRNLYSKYLLEFPYNSFDFIGLTEFYNEDLHDFSQRFLETELDAHKLNCAAEKEVRGYEVDVDFRREVEAFHFEDTRLYRRALEQRQKRVEA